MFYTTKNILPREAIDFYKNMISEHHKNNNVSNSSWENRTIDISDHDICIFIKEVFKKEININLELHQAQLQIWPEGSESQLHIHDDFNRETCTYNSLLYLNEDFEGGEFYTNNVIINPISGLITLFDGRNEYHGVKKVNKNHRYTIIFWWK